MWKDTIRKEIRKGMEFSYYELDERDIRNRFFNFEIKDKEGNELEIKNLEVRVDFQHQSSNNIYDEKPVGIEGVVSFYPDEGEETTAIKRRFTVDINDKYVFYEINFSGKGVLVIDTLVRALTLEGVFDGTNLKMELIELVMGN